MTNVAPSELINSARACLETFFNQETAQTLDTLNQCSEYIRQAWTQDPDACIATIFKKEGAYSIKHPIDSAIVCVGIVEHMDWQLPQQKSMCYAALTMNWGMFQGQEKLYHHDGDLSEGMESYIKKHPTHSVRLLKKMGVNDEQWLNTVLFHHERADGTGYPKGLKAKDIPFEVKILSFADNYTALISGRAYRQGMPPHRALRNIFMDRGNLTESKLVTQFIRRHGLYPVGTILQLVDKTTGIVVAQTDNPLKPKVYRIRDEFNRKLGVPYEVEEYEIIKIYNPVEVNEDTDLELLLGYDGLQDGFEPKQSDIMKASKVLNNMQWPHFPNVMTQIQGELFSDKLDANKVFEYIEDDPMLFSLTLMVVNEPPFQQRRPLYSLKAAFNALGVNTFWCLLLVASVRYAFCPKAPAIIATYMRILRKVGKEVQKDMPKVALIIKWINKEKVMADLIIKGVEANKLKMYRNVGSVEAALKKLGVEQFWQLLFNETLKYPFRNNIVPPVNNYILTEGLVTAWGAYSMASKVLPNFKNDAFFAGLIHHTGQIFLSQKLPSYVKEVKSKLKSPQTVNEIEESSYGTNHAMVGYMLAKNWNASDATCLAVWQHHMADLWHIDDGDLRKLTAMLVLSSSFANRLSSVRHLKSNDSKEQQQYYGDMKQLIGMDDTGYDDLQENLKKRFYDPMSNAFTPLKNL